MCNHIGEAVGRIYLNIGQEDAEAYSANHPELDAEQDVFDFPRFQVRMFVNQGGLSFTAIPPPNEDEYIDDTGFNAPAEVDWAVPHLDLRIRVNNDAMEISRYIDNDTDSSNDDEMDDDMDDEDSSDESSEESSDEEGMVH